MSIFTYFVAWTVAISSIFLLSIMVIDSIEEWIDRRKKRGRRWKS